MPPDTSPSYHSASFDCPHCEVHAHQEWSDVCYPFTNRLVSDLEVALCSHCGRSSLWYEKKLAYPTVSVAPPPHEQMPEDVKRDYKEAAVVFSQSPRSSAALLRLCVEKLTNEILQINGKSELNENIKKLVQKGLPLSAQKALDTVRVIGNNAVHPGVIDMRDDKQTAIKLFNLVNTIVDHLIVSPKDIDRLFSSLPDKDKENIAKRDNSLFKKLRLSQD